MYKTARVLVSVWVLLALCWSNNFNNTAKADDDANNDVAASYKWSYVGPYGGDVRSLVVDPSDPNRLYLGTQDGQIYRSNDAAKTWSRLTSFDHPGYCVDKIIIHESSPKTLYVPIWWTANDTDGTIYKSTDGGDTWKELKGMRDHSVRALAIAPNNPDVIIAAAIDGAYRSMDAGETWKRYSPLNHPDITRLHSVAIDPTNIDTVYLGTEHLPWKTENGGKDWVCIKGHPTEKKQQFIDDSDIFSIVIDRQDNKRVFASACSGIYNTFDAAQTWTKYQGIPFTSRRTHMIYPDPVDKNTVYSCTTQGLWKTVDNGQSWKPLTSTQVTCNALTIHPSNTKRIYLGVRSGGVLVSDNGGESFHPSNTGFVNRQISVLLADRSIKGRVYAGVLFNGFEGGLYVSDNNGGSWRSAIRGLNGEDIYTLYQQPNDEKILYAGTNLGLYKSTDRGESWLRINGAAKPPARATKPASKKVLVTKNVAKSVKRSKNLNIKPAPPVTTPAKLTDRVVAVAPGSNNTLFVAAWSGLYRISENGYTERFKLDSFNGRVLSVGTHPEHPEVIFVGTAKGLFISRDNGYHWDETAFTDSKDASKLVQVISVSPKDANVVMIATQLTCYISRDAGQTWQRRGKGIPYGDPSSIKFSATDPNIIAVGDNKAGGLYISQDGGETFKRIDRNLPCLRISAVSFDSFDASKLYVGSFSSGVYVMNAPSKALAEK